MSDRPKIYGRPKFDEQVNALEKPKSDIEILEDKISDIKSSIKALSLNDAEFAKFYNSNLYRIENLESRIEISTNVEASSYVEFRNRIEKLESENEMRKDTIGCIDSAYNDAFLQMEKQIIELSDSYAGLLYDTKFMREEIEKLKKKEEHPLLGSLTKSLLNLSNQIDKEVNNLRKRIDLMQNDN